MTAIDAFADLDQHPAVRALSASRDFGVSPTASAMSRAAQAVDCDAVVYLSPFENHPRAVTRFAAGRALVGKYARTLRAVRDPFARGFAATFRSAAPARSNASNRSDGLNDRTISNDPNDSVVLKPFRSGGGNRIRPLAGGRVPHRPLSPGADRGTPGSLVFVAAAVSACQSGFRVSSLATLGVRRLRFSLLRQYPRLSRRWPVRQRPRPVRRGGQAGQCRHRGIPSGWPERLRLHRAGRRPCAPRGEPPLVVVCGGCRACVPDAGVLRPTQARVTPRGCPRSI